MTKSAKEDKSDSADRKGEKMFDFTDDLLIGVETIDKEHQRLFQILNNILDVLGTKQHKSIEVVAIKELVKNLRKYAEEHFKHEEKYMESIHDPELIRQKSEHAKFRKMIYEFDIERLDLSSELDEFQNLMQYLVKWLHHHILGSDIMIGKFKSKGKSADAFAFADKYRTGITFVDDEHKRLFEIIGDTYNIIQAHTLHDKYDEIIKIIDELRDYTIFHFTDEEEYMTKINYEKIESHKALHEAFVSKIREINLDDVDSNQQEYLYGIIDFLLAWLDEHIMKVDKLIPVIELD
jgi:hemerythrin